MDYAIRDEYSPRFGRQVLTIWSGPFAETFEGTAVELPKGDGYMITTRQNVKIRARLAPSYVPRSDATYRKVDWKIDLCLNAYYEDLEDQ